MNRIKYIILFLIFGMFSCNDFLEEYSQDLTYASTAADLDEILVGEGYMPVPESNDLPSLEGGYYFPWLPLMTDDVKEHFSNVNENRSSLLGFYTWATYPYIHNGEIVKDKMWPLLYKHISVANVILQKSNDVSGTREDVERIQGESYFLRAMNYYFLVNLYAKPYSKNSAEQDLGVPVKTTEYIEDIYFTRNTVQEVYDQILSDLNEAKRLLRGKEHKTVYRADYYATQAFLSRIYLYMENYESAIAAADSVLEGDYSLLDYNELELPAIGDYGEVEAVSTTFKDSPETIFSQGGNAIIGLLTGDWYQVSDELVDLLRQNTFDLRQNFYLYDGYYYGTYTYARKLADRADGMVSSFCLLRLPEVLLNKAEALAQLGRDEEACQVLNELRQRRIQREHFSSLDLSGENLIDFIRDERRKELCFEGHRWFDLRRYAVNTNYPYVQEIIHDTYAMDATWQVVYQGSYRLGTYDEMPAAYVLPIPQHVIEFNRGSMVDNDPRPEIIMFDRY